MHQIVTLEGKHAGKIKKITFERTMRILVNGLHRDISKKYMTFVDSFATSCDII
jgi:hypothetical protein